MLFVFWLIQPWRQSCSCPTHFLSLCSIRNSENTMSTSIPQALPPWRTHRIYILLPTLFQINLCRGRKKTSTTTVACVPLLCLLRLLPHMIFLSAHYCCPCNARLRIASRSKSLPLSDTTAFLSQTHCLLLLLVKMNSPRQLKVWTITSAVRKVRPHALQPEGKYRRIYICHPEP